MHAESDHGAGIRSRQGARPRAPRDRALARPRRPDPLFRTPQYRSLRNQARAFDVEKPNKPVLERGHQASYVVARWFSEARVTTAFHVGYARAPGPCSTRVAVE